MIASLVLLLRVAVDPAEFIAMAKKSETDEMVVLKEGKTVVEYAPGKRNDESRAALKAVYAKLKKDGVKGLAYVEGEGLLGSDGEGTIDASHPTDVGFVRQADVIGKVLGQVLRGVKG